MTPRPTKCQIVPFEQVQYCSLCQKQEDPWGSWIDYGTEKIWYGARSSVVQLQTNKTTISICVHCWEHITAQYLNSYDLYGLYNSVAEKEKANEPPDTRYRKKKIKRELQWQVWKRDGFKCLACGTQDNLAADHVKPESKGGDTVLENLQTLCKNCNSKKKTKTIDYRKK